MDHISFKFAEPKDIFPALQACAVDSRASPAVSHHLAPLRRLARHLDASDCARENMEYLATGSGDLAIILMEPSDQEADVLYRGDTHGDNNYCATVAHLDQSLLFAFKGQRDVQNTVVLDSRPLRSNRIRRSEIQEERKMNDIEAYNAIKEVLALLSPKVIVVCQCDREGIVDGMPEYLCSSVSASGKAACLELPNGHKCIKISSFHPMFVARTEDEKPWKREMRKHLFDANLLVGANALVGRQVSGFGIGSLRECVLHGSFTSYQWSAVVASDAFIRRFEQLRIEKKTALDELLESYRNTVRQNDAVGPKHILREEQSGYT